MGYGPLFGSWVCAVPFSVASGALLGAPVSKGSKAGAAIMIFISSVLVSYDLCSRAGKGMGYVAPMAILMFLSVYLPWVLAINKDPKNKGRAAALPISGLLYALIAILFSAVMYGSGEVSRSAGLQGAVITLMYVFISTSLGYQSVRAKKDPVAKAQSIYMAGLLVLLTMFDVLGAKNSGDAVKGKVVEANSGSGNDEPTINEGRAGNAGYAKRLNQMTPKEGGLKNGETLTSNMFNEAKAKLAAA